jgi:hypothetical protein
MQGNDTNIITVTDKLKTFTGKLGLWARKLERKQCAKQVTLELISVSKITWLICSPGFCKYFPEAVTDKYKWITDPFHADSPQNYDFSLEEGNYINIISDTPLKVRFPRKSYIEFWVRIGEEVPYLSWKSCEQSPSFHNILPVQDWIFSSGSQQNKVSFYERPFLNSRSFTINYVQRSNHIHPTNPGMKRVFYFSQLSKMH